MSLKARFWLTIAGAVATTMLLPRFSSGQAAPKETAAPESAIRATLDAQAAAWNQGSIEGFMDGYVRGEVLRFASGGTIQRGWQATLERYQKRYATRQQMGQLTFSDLEIKPLSGEFAEVFGRYRLKREQNIGDATGLFTLLMQKSDDRWLVLHDHTSAAE